MKRRLTAFLFLPFALASCSKGPVSFSRLSFGSLVSGPFETVSEAGYERRAAYVSSIAGADLSLSTDYHSILSTGTTPRRSIPSTGEQKMLVIPIDFSDAPNTSLRSDAIPCIEQAFFGDGASQLYRSVSSYYETASYGRLHLSGSVAPSWYRSSFTASYLSTLKTPSSNKSALEAIYKSALSWYASTYPEDPLASYEVTPEAGDPYVPVYFVYSAPYSESRSSMLWAFTITDPAPVSWTSFQMLNAGDSGVDAHTIIHETGHLLGLDDYYDTTSSTSLYSPLGRGDMMDCSLGEQNPFSKMLMNWASPIVVKGASEITLHSSSGNPEFVLLSSSWNGTPYDEYVLLEFYTPSLLNAVDASDRAEDYRLPRKPGIKAYHVDGRLGVYEKLASAGSFLTPSSLLAGKTVRLHQSNDQPLSWSTEGTLIQAIDASSGSSTLARNFVFSDQSKTLSDGTNLRDALFQKGMSSFHIPFHGETTMGYRFSVTALTASYAKVSFEPIAM